MHRCRTCISILALLAIILPGGCASNTALNRKTQDSLAAIRAAEELGANEIPTAAYYLQLAREEFAKTEELINQGNKTDALSMSSRASADAELAVLLSREDAEKMEAQKAVKEVQDLRNDNQITDEE